MVVAGLARQDCSELIGACAAAEASGTLTGHHVLHQLVALAVFAALVLALFVLPRGLRRTPWARTAGPTRLAGVAALVLLLALLGGATGDVGGLAQRVFLALAFGWPVLLAARCPAGRRSHDRRDSGRGGLPGSPAARARPRLPGRRPRRAAVAGRRRAGHAAPRAAGDRLLRRRGRRGGVPRGHNQFECHLLSSLAMHSKADLRKNNVSNTPEQENLHFK